MVMAASKTSSMTDVPLRPRKSISTAAEVAVLRQRIEELESQVADYKVRLDELRRAKNTTILKREREVLQVNAPDLGKRGGSSDSAEVADLQKRLRQSEELRRNEISELTQKNSKLLQANVVCKHPKEIEQLNMKLDEVRSDNAALIVENDDLKEQIRNLTYALSVKEAKWCEREEQLNLKLKTQWSEKYEKWIAETERQLEDLRRSNAFLTSYINDESKTSDVARRRDDSALQ